MPGVADGCRGGRLVGWSQERRVGWQQPDTALSPAAKASLLATSSQALPFSFRQGWVVTSPEALTPKTMEQFLQEF